MSQKYVELVITSVQTPTPDNPNSYTISVDMPPNQTILPPGPSFIVLLYDGMACDQMGEVILYIQ